MKLTISTQDPLIEVFILWMLPLVQKLRLLVKLLFNQDIYICRLDHLPIVWHWEVVRDDACFQTLLSQLKVCLIEM